MTPLSEGDISPRAPQHLTTFARISRYSFSEQQPVHSQFGTADQASGPGGAGPCFIFRFQPSQVLVSPALLALRGRGPQNPRAQKRPRPTQNGTRGRSFYVDVAPCGTSGDRRRGSSTLVLSWPVECRGGPVGPRGASRELEPTPLRSKTKKHTRANAHARTHTRAISNL